MLIVAYFIGEGVDYTPESYDIMLLNGMTRAAFNISIINDDILERNETFTLTIDQSTLPSSVTIGDTSQATVIIEDDDG